MSIERKVTKENLGELVARSTVEYAVFGDKLTIAVITLPSGFKVTGEGSCVDAANYDKALGEKYALEKAVAKLWELEGYLLAERLQRHDEWQDNMVGHGRVMEPYNSDEVVEVRAIQWTGNNAAEVDKIINKSNGPEGESMLSDTEVFLSNADGMTVIPIGGYIVEHVTGDLFYCPQDEFSERYAALQTKTTGEVK